MMCEGHLRYLCQIPILLEVVDGVEIPNDDISLIERGEEAHVWREFDIRNSHSHLHSEYFI